MLLRIRLLEYKIKFNYYSTENAIRNNIKYTDTINLPKTKFPARLTPVKRNEIEKRIIETNFKNLYKYQESMKREPSFVLHDGPPYANGDLHMGHAVNKILKDITLRYNVVNGKKVHYIAGWDCHGLPIEIKAMTGNHTQNPISIRQKSRQFAAKTIEKQLKEFKSWGVMADWNNSNNIYKTFNATYIEQQLKIFWDLFQKKLVYRDLKPVYWSPSSKTALAEAELEYDPNFVSPSVFLRIKLNKFNATSVEKNANVFALIWTTTPWTLPSNQAICYNSNFEYSLIKLENVENHYYLIASVLMAEFQKLTNLKAEVISTVPGKNLENCTYFHPFDKNSILKFIPADHVEDNKGTGLVHTAPAHGPDDFLVGLKNKIEVKCFVDENGNYTTEAPDFLKGKSVLDEGDDIVLDYLKRDLIYLNKITHAYPIDWRTKKPVIIRASKQWFIDTEKIKSVAASEIDKIQFYPKVNAEIHKKALLTQVQKRPYWCISRQRSWGVPIPVFYCKNTEEIITNEKILNQICSKLLQNGNMDFWWSDEVKNILPESILNELQMKEEDLKKGSDIFDIWFDSGVSWMNALDKEKVADVYLEGVDQFTGWFQSSLLMSIAYRNIAPYKSLFVHGFTVDEKGHKMSKSLGNVILPKDIIQKYGTDSLRWWVASHGTQNSAIVVSDNLLQASTENITKIRSILRYLNGVIGKNDDISQDEQHLNYLDKYFLNSLWHFDHEIGKLYSIYEYNRATATILNFITNQISAVYLNLVKDRLYCGNHEEYEAVKYISRHCFRILCKHLYPIVPFLVEESWSYHDDKPFYENHFEVSENWKNKDAETIVNNVLNLRRNLNQNTKGFNSWTLNCEISCNENDLDLLLKVHPKINEIINSSELCELLQVSSIVLRKSLSSQNSEVKFNMAKNALCPRCRRFAIENEIVCSRCENVLAKIRI